MVDKKAAPQEAEAVAWRLSEKPEIFPYECQPLYTSPPTQALTEAQWALKAAREIVDAVAGENKPARDWAIRVRDRIDSALTAAQEASHDAA